MEINTIALPKSVGLWTRSPSPQKIDATNIFKYMNGAGELYLGYRFKNLNVYQYTSKTEDEILVELYFMENSDDAFGLLSLDWGGEPVVLADGALPPQGDSSIRALYGAGLLRIWLGNLYARVMTFRETGESKKAVLNLGKAIAAHRDTPAEPALLKKISSDAGLNWRIRKDRLSFFRSYLALNSIYYISHENILNLDLDTQAVIVPYEKKTDTKEIIRCHFLLTKYKDDKLALKALNRFHKAYLPEHQVKLGGGPVKDQVHNFKIEDGWLAYKLIGNHLAIVFQSPDMESAKRIITENVSNLTDP